jgi:hypothetical protein
MGGQGFIPEDGEGGLVEGNREANQRREENAYEWPDKAAPRAGMQGDKKRGTVPEQPLDRPGVTPPDKPGTGGRGNDPSLTEEKK